jgi:unsaturated chondroitin disaccharide hydrolase
MHDETPHLLTNNADYKRILLRAADSLASLFNPKIGTILMAKAVTGVDWPKHHNTIMDKDI